MSLFSLIISLLLTVTFIAATPIDPEANYKIINCSNENLCWGTDNTDSHYVGDVSINKCSLYKIDDVSSFGNNMIIIRTAKNDPSCSDCNINMEYSLRAFEHRGKGLRIISPFILMDSPLENICLPLGYRPYKLVRV